MQFVPTNDAFHHLVNLLGLSKEREQIIQLFESGGYSDVTNAKIKAWRTKSGGQKPGYREMPREALDAFIDGLYQRNEAAR